MLCPGQVPEKSTLVKYVIKDGMKQTDGYLLVVKDEHQKMFPKYTLCNPFLNTFLHTHHAYSYIVEMDI